MRYALILFILIGVKCTAPEPSKLIEKKYFDLPSFTQSIIEQQSKAKLTVLKKSIINGLQEEKVQEKSDSSFWATELFLLLSADLNKPQLQTAYTIEEHVTETNSNLLKTVYTALPTARSNIRKIEFKYLSSPAEIRQIIVEQATDNTVYSTQQSTHVWLNNIAGTLLIDSLVTTGFNKTILLDSMKYSSTVLIK